MPGQIQNQEMVDFAAAFEEELGSAVAAAEPAAAAVEPAAAAPAAVEPAAVEPAVVEPAAAAPAAVESAAVEPAAAAPAAVEPTAAVPAAAEPAAAPAPAAVDWEARARAMEAQLAAQPKPAAAEPAAPAAAPPLYSDEERAAIEAYRTDWPDVAKAEALVRRAEYSQLLNYVMGQLEQRFAPIQEYVGSASESEHYNSIVQAHGDYDEHVDKIEAWIGEQPDILRKSLTDVATNGDTAAVIGLVTLYKQANGIQPKLVVTPPAVVSPAPVVTPPANTQPSKQAAAQRLSPVSTQRTQVPTVADPQDFASAFAEFALEEK